MFFLVPVHPILFISFDKCPPFSSYESFNDWGGRGYNDSVPGWSPKQPLPRIGLRDLLYGRQAGGWSNMSPGGAIFGPSPFKTGTNLRHPLPPQSLNDSYAIFFSCVAFVVLILVFLLSSDRCFYDRLPCVAS